MRILVTGGAGFIGSAVLRQLVGAGHEVLNIDKLTYAGHLSSLAPVSACPNLRFLKADICDRPAMVEAFEGFRPEWVMHLAAESHVDRSVTGAADFIETNVMGSFTLLEVARHYWTGLPEVAQSGFRFLHVSTDEVFGSLGAEGLFKETTPYDPSSPYSASKAASDHLAKAWHRTYGLPVVLSNCSNNYGPYQFPEKLIPLHILNARDGHPLPVYGNGSNIRDWLYVEDHVSALVLICDRGRVGETYAVGGRNERSNIEVVRRICTLMDERIPKSHPHETLIRFVTDRPGHDHRYAIDATRLETELGWRARETFETGLARTVDWYLSHEDWWRPLRGDGTSQGVYGGERLGLLNP